MKVNPLAAIDFYKSDHRRQYPAGTEAVYSNFTPRSARLAPVLAGFDDRVMFFGLQGFIKDVLITVWNEGFFNQPKDVVVADYKRRMDTSLSEGAVPVEHIAALHDLGYLPLEIKAVPEGSRVNMRVPMLTIINTDPRFFWLTNYLETCISAELWKPCTTATIAYEYKRLLEDYAVKTGSSLETVAIQGHDFSFRGMSGIEDAAKAGAGHLTSFVGTDTIPAIDYVEQYYGKDMPVNEPIGISVPATEHSVMCMGTQDGELETFRRLVTELYPSGIVSIVSDTWDFWQVITEFAAELKNEIVARSPNAIGLAKVVFRPDSGDPVKILCGDPAAEAGSPAFKGAVECLWDIFGGTITATGYKMLHERVGLIYGDSITLERAQAILKGLAAKGFASGNVVFGIGSYTYQHITRDCFGFAMKATWGRVNGDAREIFKDPVTDNGEKRSARGLLRVEETDEGFALFDQQTQAQEQTGALQTVFKDGKLVRETNLQAIRARLAGLDDTAQNQRATA